MNYFEQLKEKHDTPQKAYLEYQLSKKYLRVFSCSEKAPENIKESISLQEKINNYSRELISNPNKNVDLKTILGIKDIASFFKEKSNSLEFIGVERDDFIQLISGMYEINLKQSSKNISWEKLEEIIVEEKNNVPILTKEETQEILDKTVKDYGLTSLSFGQIRTNEESVRSVDKSLEQLTIVIDCEKEQVGNNFNLFFDTENTNFAGYSSQHFNQQKLYLNARLSEDAFAHEWFHSIDNMLAKHHKLDTTHASEAEFTSISKLLESSTQLNEDAIKELKENINQKCLVHLSNIVDRFDKIGSISEVDKFKEMIEQNYEKVISGSWNKEDFITNAKKHQKENNACISYLASELDLMKEFNSNNFNVSSFYKYAVLMDENLKNAKIMKDDYSTTKLEMMARSFETFVDIKLDEKGIKNLISNASGNNYAPDKIEMKHYLSEWENVVSDIRGLFNDICPVKKMKDNFDISKISANINIIRDSALSETTQNNKIKIG